MNWLQVSGLLIIGKNEEWTALFLHDAKFSNLPPYLRIKSVEVGDGGVFGGSDLFEDAIQLITPLILQLKPALVGSDFDVNFPELYHPTNKTITHAFPSEISVL